MNIAKISARRHACKAYDPSKKISEDKIGQLYSLLRNSPSSVNSQPWHYIVANSDEGKQKILPAFADFNRPRIEYASHVIVFCAITPLEEDHIKAVLEQEDQDQRFPEPEMKSANDQGRRHFVKLNSQTEESQEKWTEKQIYIALGTLLLGASALEIDSTPIEGFDQQKLDQILGLESKNLRSIVVASLGYRSDEDYNANLPKSRFSLNDLFTFM